MAQPLLQDPIEAPAKRPDPLARPLPPAGRLAAALAVAAVLAALSAFLCRHYYQRDLSAFHPNHRINDQWGYDAQTRSFLARGFGGGYFGFDEKAAPSSWNRFSVHGPAYPLALAATTRLLNLAGIRTERTVPVPYANLLWITAGLVVALGLLGRTVGSALALSAFCLTFWPFLLYLPNGMQEALHLSFALVLGALLGRPPYSRRKAAALLLSLFALSLVRVSWALLFLPLVPLLSGRPLRWKSLVGPAALGAVCLVAAFWCYNRLLSPFPANQGGFVFIQLLTGEVPFRYLVTAVSSRIQTYFLLANRAASTPLEVVFRMQYLALGSLAAWVARGKKDRPDALDGAPALFLALALGLPLACLLGLYFVGYLNDYRVLAAFFLAAVLYAYGTGSRPGRAFLLGTAAVNLLTAPLALRVFESYNRGSFDYDAAAVDGFGREMAALVPFRENASGWCNTLLSLQMEVRRWDLPVALPDGVGLHFGSRGLENVALPPKSAHLLTSEPELAALPGVVSVRYEPGGAAVLQTARGPLRWRKRASTPLGDLYENLDADCPRS